MTTIAATPARDATDLASVLKAGAVVAILDGLFAILLYSVIVRSTTAPRIFQGIASNLIGKGAFDGGAPTVALGVLLHFTVAYTWTTVYYVALRTFASLRDVISAPAGKAFVGVALGATIWLVMDFVVIPLTGGKPAPPSGWRFSVQLVWHMIAVGPPIVAIVRYRRARDSVRESVFAV